MSTLYTDLLEAGVPNATAYLRHVVAGEKQNPYVCENLANGFQGIYMELAKLELANRGEKVSLTIENFEKSLHRVHERLDCGDFVIPAFLYILYRYENLAVLPKEIYGRLKDEVLGFKYWIDEPGVDIYLPCYFTENHQILFHTIEYLAGQRYPNEVFESNEQTGLWHMNHAKTYLDRWLTWRQRFGFSEWLSSGYYAEDLLALLTLRTLADDESLKVRASMLMDLLLFDIALNSYQGVFGSTNGRMYNALTMNPVLAATNVLAAYLWGSPMAKENYTKGGIAPAAILMAVTDYRTAEAIEAVAHDKVTAMENRERMSLNVEDSEKYGIDPSDFDNIMLYWSLHTFHHRKVIENSRKFCPEWYNMDASIAANYEKFRLMDLAGAYADPDPNGSALTQVDIYTYRTGNYMLSCAQNYRKGRTNFQQHLWQATLGEKALVFVTNPGSADYTGRPNYFVGNGHMPKATAYQNVLITIHRIPAESTHSLSTHAYFPRHEFDEVAEKNGWIFGRKGEGYVALRSYKQGGSWRAKDPALFQSIYRNQWQSAFDEADSYEFWVPGHANVWVCEMGEPATHGSFSEFIDKMAAAELSGDTFSFRYESPSLGTVETGWEKPFIVNGKAVEIRDYPRYDNPYCQAPFDTARYGISAGNASLWLDFENLERIEKGK